MSVELPKFPSKKIGGGAHLVDMTLVADRVTELQAYFSELLKKNPQVLRLDILYDELGITEAAKKDKKVAFLKQALEQYGRKFPDEKKKSREWNLFAKTQQLSAKEPQSTAKSIKTPTIMTKPANDPPLKKPLTPIVQTQDQINDYLLAQRFHMLAKSGTGIPGLYYKHGISFELGEDIWMMKDRTIREELCKRIWFSFAGPIPAATAGWERSHTDDCYAVVNAAASVPLLYIVVPKDGNKGSIDIFEAMIDGKIGSMLCTIKNSEENIVINVGGRTCVSSGDWKGDENKFELRQSADEGGPPSALIRWGSGHDNKSTINVSIKAHRDILFYIGVVIGINFLNAQNEQIN